MMYIHGMEKSQDFTQSEKGGGDSIIYLVKSEYVCSLMHDMIWVEQTA